MLPLIVRSPGPLDQPAGHVTLVVMPYLTWHAYNRQDANRDGREDTWYRTRTSRVVSLTGPYETPAVPARRAFGAEQDYAHTKRFMGIWRALGGEQTAPAQFVTDVEFATLPPDAIRRYAAVVFLGHTEYYTAAMFLRLRDYELHGGHFIYASANGFYAYTLASGGSLRLLHRPYRRPTQNDALITGVQYTGCCWTEARTPGPFVLSGQAAIREPWLLAGTGLRAGDSLGPAGGEIDGIGPESPHGMTVIAGLRWRLRREARESGAMVVLHRPGGGLVFSAGNMDFLNEVATRPQLELLFANLWRHFAGIG
jgi:hypothetical protein